MVTPDLAEILAHADRRTLAAVVTHLAGDPDAVPDLRDPAQIEAKAAEVLPPYLGGEKTAVPPTDDVLQAARPAHRVHPVAGRRPPDLAPSSAGVHPREQAR